MTPNNSFDMPNRSFIHKLTKSSLPKCIYLLQYLVEFCTCDIFNLINVYTYNYLQAYGKLSAQLEIFISYISRMAKYFERVNIKQIKMKRLASHAHGY